MLEIVNLFTTPVFVQDYNFDLKLIELKSLILAQIERWRNALHMQVERQHGELALWWRVANG